MGERATKTSRQKLRFDKRYLQRVAASLGHDLRAVPGARTTTVFESMDGQIQVVGRVNRGAREGRRVVFWFNFEKGHENTLTNAAHAYVALGCGSPDSILLIPFDRFKPWLASMSETKRASGQRNIRVIREDGRYTLQLKSQSIDLTCYLVEQSTSALAKAPAASTTRIVTTPRLRGGRPTISGSRIAVADIAVMHLRLGQSTEEIAGKYDLPLAAVHAALAYYYDHRREIDAQLQADQDFAEDLRQSQRSPLQEKLHGV